MTKQIEMSALKTEDDKGSIKRREVVETEVKELEETVQSLTDMWQDELKALNLVKDLKEELAKSQRDVDVARSKGDFAKVGELLHSTIPGLRHELEAFSRITRLTQRMMFQEKLLARIIITSMTS